MGSEGERTRNSGGSTPPARRVSGPLSRRVLEGAILAAAAGTILVEWAGYAAHVARLSYALVVPLLAGVLAILPRPAGAPALPAPGPRDRRIATAGLFAAAFLLALGSLAAVFSLAIAAVPAGILALAVAWGGTARLRERGWAALLLWGMVPVPTPLLDLVNPPLSEATGRLAALLARPFDPAAGWAGAELAFRGWTLRVAEACSGSSTLLVYSVLAIFLAGLLRPGPWLAAGLFLAVVPLTLVVNGTRIAATALLLDRFGPAAAEGVAHEVLGQGLVVAGAGILALALALASRRGRSA
ncbi:MAG: exosortase/archaeosortase family protein [Planctomycetota bacterium]